MWDKKVTVIYSNIFSLISRKPPIQKGAWIFSFTLLIIYSQNKQNRLEKWNKNWFYYEWQHVHFAS